jgi:hypothetical protein
LFFAQVMRFAGGETIEIWRRAEKRSIARIKNQIDREKTKTETPQENR